ncbi:MAG: aminotransferase class I/II-fold pyridoxal phosphate-dependent enzyme, partial [Candidatus Cloacimonetes bacterium]|nr:aminotransferase class I/II-fold pyridoxal phosphate-dependent enzyme [Candidatus Cloacimonadota bacterium]
GSVYTRRELKKIAQICLKYNLLIIADEIYEKLIYDGQKHISIASLSPEVKNITVVINGVSKAYAMTGWRLGYAAGPGDIIKLASRIQSHTTSNVNSMTQKAVVAALNQDEGSVERMRKEFEKRRDYLYSTLINIPHIKCHKPQGAFYALPYVGYYLRHNLRRVRNTVTLCEYLLENYNIALVPGSAFGIENYVRFSYANSMDNIKTGLERFRQGLQSLIG